MQFKYDTEHALDIVLCEGNQALEESHNKNSHGLNAIVMPNIPFIHSSTQTLVLQLGGGGLSVFDWRIHIHNLL